MNDKQEALLGAVLGRIELRLIEIHKTLQEMKEQERAYWETWKKAKEREP